jgi:hypothetical protein
LSILLGDYKNLQVGIVLNASKLKWLSKNEGALLKLKTRSGSYSGLDQSIQARKTQKSHATVPLKSFSKRFKAKTGEY